MSQLLAVHYVIVLVFVGLLLWAVISDVATLRIPNRVSLGLCGLFLVHVVASPVPVDWLGGILVAAPVFVVGTVFFHFRVMGGGDVKLMTALALWAGPHGIAGLIVFTGLAGGLLALVALSPLRPVFGFAVQALGGADLEGAAAKGVLPYGVAIAVGGVFVAALLIAP